MTSFYLFKMQYILQSPNGDLVLSNLGGSNTGISGLYDCSMIFFNDSGVQSNVTVARYRVNTNESKLTERLCVACEPCGYKFSQTGDTVTQCDSFLVTILM